MNQLITQFRELAPSAKEALYRRLMTDEGLSYLREKNSIIGFEVDTSVEQVLSGFTLIGIQKHTIYAYCADLHEKPKLILFPSLEKLFDPSFELLDLHVIKRRIRDSSFQGTTIDSGLFSSLVRDLTPPEKEVDVSPSVTEQMAKHMSKVAQGEVAAVPSTPPKRPMGLDKKNPVPEPETFTEPPMDEGFVETGYDGYSEYEGYQDGYDSYNGYDAYTDSYGGYDSGYQDDGYRPVPESPAEDARSTKLKAQTFQNLSDVTDYCVTVLGVQRPLAVTVVNKALQSPVAPEYRISLAKKLFCKLFDEKKI